jgi:hypothetical protein
MDRRRFLSAMATGVALSPIASMAMRGAPPPSDVAPSLCTGPQPLNPSIDLSYLGMFKLFAPNGVNTFLGFSGGAITGRRVNGNVHLLVAGSFPRRNGGSDPIYEVAYPGVGASIGSAPAAPLVQNWGDIYQGRRPTQHGNLPVLRGLLYADDMLLWSYGDEYNAGSPSWDPSVGASVLNPNGTVATYGPWRTSIHSQMTRGYMVRHPTTGQVGYGGPITSGNIYSPWGAEVALGAVPSLSRAPSAVGNPNDIAIQVTPFIHHDVNSKQVRHDTNYRLCGWNVLYDSAAGGYTLPGPNSFDSIDVISAAAWVRTANCEGIVCFGQMTQTIPGTVYGGGDNLTHRWYGPTTCVHGQDGSGVSVSVGEAAGSQVLQMWVFDPSHPNVDPVPIPVRTLIPSLNRASHLYQFGGAWFDQPSSLLFVSEIMADRTSNNYEAQPVIHVFSVR